LGPWKNAISQAAQAPGPATDNAPQSTLVLAANRTNRVDILREFRRYRGGWDIANRHYWAVSPVSDYDSAIRLIPLNSIAQQALQYFPASVLVKLRST
jgi:hypothetical protein